MAAFWDRRDKVFHRAVHTPDYQGNSRYVRVDDPATIKMLIETPSYLVTETSDGRPRAMTSTEAAAQIEALQRQANENLHRLQEAKLAGDSEWLDELTRQLHGADWETRG
jgi:hypothetical protein